MPITPSQTDPTQLAVGLRWKSGASCQLAVTRRRNAIQLRTTDPDAIALATRVGPGLDNAALAAALNRAGHRTGTGQPGPPRKFRTSIMGLSYAASCSFRNSLWTSLGVR